MGNKSSTGAAGGLDRERRGTRKKQAVKNTSKPPGAASQLPGSYIDIEYRQDMEGSLQGKRNDLKKKKNHL